VVPIKKKIISWGWPVNLSEATILLVDDEPDLLEIFGKWLELAGCRKVYTAKDGEGALAIIRGRPIDLLVTDVRMPGMDGITLVRKLAGLGSSIPSIVFISGFGDIGEREMFGLGVEAFLAKPLPRGQLVQVAEMALAEPSTLWLTRMKPAPRQSIEITVEDIGETKRQDSIRLGRGGFSARYSGPSALGEVAFKCHFSSDQREMTGEGYVRWRSKNHDKIGIEFSFLDANCRSWVLEEIAVTNPRSFIPSFL
jgi:CheY-like chemotaxis protein